MNLSCNVGFLNKGAKGEEQIYPLHGGDIERKTLKPRLNYFSLNFLLDLKYPIKKNISPFLSVGPRLDYLISYNIDKNYIWFERGAFKDFNYGFLIGVGLKYDLSRLQIGVRADYYLNFSNFFDIYLSSASQQDWTIKVYDRTYTINLTMGYKLK